MVKFHISEDGVPRRCAAKDAESCPVGGDHFNTRVQAQAAYEASQDSKVIAATLKRRPAAGEEVYKQVVDREEETVPPVPVFEPVKVDTTAGNIKTGHVLLDGARELKVRGVKVGYKNATIQAEENGKTRTIVLKTDEPVQVIEQQKTKETIAAERAYARESGLEYRVKTYHPTRAAIVAKMTENIKKGHRLDAFDVRALIEAEANDSVMAEYEHAVSRVKERIAEGRPEFKDETRPYTRAYEILKAEWSEHLLSRAERGESNSTSEVSNSFDREQDKARARFVRGGIYF